MSEYALEARKAKLFREGTLLFVGIGATVGKVGIASVPCSANQQIMGLVFKPAVSADFAYYWFRAHYSLVRRVAGTATLPILNQAGVKALPFSYPKGRLRQEQIVNRIEELLTEVKEARALLGEMRRDAERMMEAALVETLIDLDAEFLESPSVGDLVAAGQIELSGGGTPSKSNIEYWTGTIPWVSPKDMKRWKIGDTIDHVSPTAVKETSVKLIPKGAILVVTRGMILAHTWPVAVTTAEVTINQDMKALSPKGGVLSEYLAYVLRARAPEVLQQVEIAAHGTRRLTTGTLAAMPIPLPDTVAQERIVAHLDAVQAEVDRMRETLDEEERLLDRLERSILEKAFRGEL